MQTILSFISLHLAAIWTRKVDILMALFVIFLIAVLFSFAGWMRTMRDQMTCGWFALIVFLYGVLWVMIDADRGKSAYFLAMRQFSTWCWAQVVVMAAMGWAFIAVTGLPIWIACEVASAVHAVAMALFVVIFAISTLTSIQPQIVGLGERKKKAVLGVTSLPWVAIAWIIGISASEAALRQADFSVSIAGLALFAVIEAVVAMTGLREKRG